MGNKLLRLLVFFGLVILLTGCVHSYYQRVEIIKINNYYAQMFSERLGKFGVTVIQNREQLQVILPQRVFIAGAANFAILGPRILDEVSNLLKCYELEVVRVEGIIPAEAYGEKTQVLAEERAHKVIKYLVAHGIDMSLAYPVGQLRSQVKENLPSECVVISLKKL